MTHITDNEFRVELKYCELCGGLWFRHETSAATLCVPCTNKPHFLLSPFDLPTSRLEAATWYGPMSGTIHRLDAVAESRKPETGFPDLARDFSPGFAPQQVPQSRRDGWISGGAA